LASSEAITVGRYTLFGRIGSGGMATVHLGQLNGASGFRRIVAIKRLHAHVAKQPELAGMLVDEARIVSRIAHPNVVQVLDLVQSEDELLIVMEYLRGAALSTLLRAHPAPPPIPLTLAIATQALAGLHAAHEARDEGGALLGLVHRDVSPDNIHVGVDGVARVLDFGIAKAAGRLQDTGEGVMKGKVAYAPPEQLSGHVTRRSDVYAMGVVVWEMLARRRLVEGGASLDAVSRVLAGGFAPPSRHNASVPPALDAIVMRALSREAAARFATAEEMARALASVAPMASIAEIAAWVAAGAGDSLRTRESEIAAIESAVPTVHESLIRTPAPTARVHGVGAEPTSFLGREGDLHALSDLLRGARVVTLLGPGGIGKTRLSRRYALVRAHDYESIWFCDLTECKTEDEVAVAFAAAIDATLTNEKDASDVVASLGRAVDEKGTALFVLDNCEQIVAEAARLVDASSRVAPRSRWLCTSRERLRIDGEQVHELAPLASEESVRLFVERAKRARASFELGADAPIVAEIVRRLDGMPLAIELAAARIAVMDPKTLLARLEATGIRLLSAGLRTATERQRSLRGAIDWSWTLLEPWERAALAQCAVFRGGFWLDAAEAVIDLAPWDEAPPCLDVVQSLVDKSLLRSFEVPAFPGEVRFGMYESIREFALEKLAQDPDAAARAHARHARCFLDAWAAWDEVTWYGAVPGVPRLALERDNLLAIHARARAAAHADLLRAQVALFPLYAARGPHAGFWALLDVGKDDAIPAEPRVRARHALVRGRAAQLVSLREQATRDFERARATAAQLGDAQLAARALAYLGTARRADGKLGDARLHYREALALFEQAGDRRAAGVVLSALAALDLAEQKLESARALIDHAIQTSRELGDEATVGMMLIDAGVTRQELGDFAGAQGAYDEAVTILERLGHARHRHIAEGYRASLAFERGDFARALDGYARALEGIRAVGDAKWVAVLGAGVGACWARLGDVQKAEERFADAERDTKLEPRYTTTVALLRGQLDLARGDADGARRRIAFARELTRSSDDVRFALRVLERALAQSPAR